MRIHKFAAAAVLGLAALGVSGCATGLSTKVTRYSTTIPQGQTFYVVPGQGVQPGLEFNRFASLVAQQMVARGYSQAPSTAAADMLVKVAYNVDQGEQHVSVDPFYGDPFYGSGFYGGGFYGRPYWSRFGYFGHRSPFYWGWDDPFWYAPYGSYGGYGGYGLRDPIREYTVYQSELDLDIVRRVDNAPLFDGRAKARSQTDELGTLVPNLIEAMFTNFPGENGKTVKITVPARKRG